MASLWERRSTLADYVGLAAVLVLLCAVFAATTENFLKPATLTSIANQSADAVVLATGMTFVLIIGGIDLSVGSVLALSGAVLGVCLKDHGWPLPLAVLACLGTGLLCGALNGLVVTQWNIPSFIVTLGMMQIARGATYLVTHSRTVYLGKGVLALTRTVALDLTVPFFLAIAIVVGGQVFLSRTAYGRHMLAVGANEDAARLSGLNARAIKLSVFILSGLMAAVAAVIYTGRLSAADPNAGLGCELQAIAAAVIGGTSLMGGRGSVVSSLLGVLVIAVLGYGLVLVEAKEPVKWVVTGCIIVVAVVLDHYRSRLPRAV